MDEPLTTVLLHAPTCGLETTPCALQLTVVAIECVLVIKRAQATAFRMASSAYTIMYC